MKFRAKIVDAACLNHFTRVSAMIAKLAKTCALRISPQKLNFILSDKVASGGVSMWCELEQENFFSEFQMEGVSTENNAIYLELTSENLSRALKTAQNARALKVKLTNKHFPCLTVSIELLSVSSSSRIVTHDIPVKVIPRKLWKDLQEPTVPDSDVSVYLPVLKTMKSVVEKMRNLSNHLIIEANLSGDLNLKIETELVCVTTHFKDLGNPPLASEDASQDRDPAQMAEVHIDIRKLLQFLAGQQVNPTRAVCRGTDECQTVHCCGQGHDPVTPGRTSVLRAHESPKGVSDDPQRCVWAACSWSSPGAAPPRAAEHAGLHPSDGAPVPVEHFENNQQNSAKCCQREDAGRLGSGRLCRQVCPRAPTEPCSSALHRGVQGPARAGVRSGVLSGVRMRGCRELRTPSRGCGMVASDEP
ncbi:checkpoint protein HUS1 isoform X2 [Enhydra lutris kenyoni]|uniref:Checkpoint protein HUS1 n=1 Tax=Enhydra lutris kenyoni TaxID=391180 RepID=A0A2Y9KXK8_ENHLU|nr:checkpoint protein HUS1 isoform X2 [Enhydra lutris kenyoni]